ncbi:hypothetical protein [Arthrobacter sp. CAN_A1]|uniref:hypothetical protein n=1 Tax=Arthrobacter sp. CAN_A1 TaxID=2787717 RepID=UPI0018C928ED
MTRINRGVQQKVVIMYDEIRPTIERRISADPRLSVERLPNADNSLEEDRSEGNGVGAFSRFLSFNMPFVSVSAGPPVIVR